MTGALLVAALAGCAGSGDDDRPDDGSGGCVPPAEPTISYASNIQPIYDASCALSGCHIGVVTPNLAAGVSWGATVDVESIGRPALDLVAPGVPDDSYLVRKIEGAPGIAGEPMPRDAPPLSADQIVAIRQWITECALDN